MVIIFVVINAVIAAITIVLIIDTFLTSFMLCSLHLPFIFYHVILSLQALPCRVFKERNVYMTKSEVALELTKLIADRAIANNRFCEDSNKPEKVITETYNYIFQNIFTDSE